MRFRIFKSILIPYLLCLLILFFFSIHYYKQREVDLSRNFVNQEFIRISQEIGTIVENDENYKDKVKSMIGHYKVGNIIYAWLLDKKSKDIVFSENQKFIMPSQLLFDRDVLFPFIIKNLPSGEKILESKNCYKIVKYSQIRGTDYILVLVCNVTKIFGFSLSHYNQLWIIAFLLFVFGFIFSLFASSKISKIFSEVSSYIYKEAFENFESDRSFSDNEEYKKITRSSYEDLELSLILTSFNKIITSKRKPAFIDLNPLTNLPGNTMLEKELFSIIDSKDKFTVGSVNINNFCSYNHKYGFKKGDSVILFLCSALKSALNENGEKNDFISHLGSDRFVFITRSTNIDTICKEAINIFDEHIKLYYDKSDRDKGYILSKNFDGEFEKFDFISISIGLVSNHNYPLIHPLQIGHITNEILDYLKRNNKSGYLLDRRYTDRNQTNEKETKSSSEISVVKDSKDDSKEIPKEVSKNNNIQAEEIDINNDNLTDSSKVTDSEKEKEI